MGTSDNDSNHTAKNRDYQELCLFELLAIFIAALCKCSTIIAFILCMFFSFFLCCLGQNLAKESGNLVTLSGFCLAALAILYSNKEIRSLKRFHVRNLFAEFSIGAMIPLLNSILDGIIPGKLYGFFYYFTFLWAIHLCMHLFSISSFIYNNNKK